MMTFLPLYLSFRSLNPFELRCPVNGTLRFLIDDSFIIHHQKLVLNRQRFRISGLWRNNLRAIRMSDEVVNIAGRMSVYVYKLGLIPRSFETILLNSNFNWTFIFSR